jgi:UDP-galactopyranose mutase
MSIDTDVVCLSHLRWDFVWQRPQHLLRRAARGTRVFYVEEPVDDPGRPHLRVSSRPEGITVIEPHLPKHLSGAAADHVQTELLADFFAEHDITEYVLWYYTPMALAFTEDLDPLAIVYDCMDELSQFALAPHSIKAAETRLLARADLVFTGGQSIFELKSRQHRRVFPFPSSVERDHFVRARGSLPEPADQVAIPHPRLGFYGVIDERMDLGLLAGVAESRPDWHLVIIGPLTKIEMDTLPQRANIHYLGAKSYTDLPNYIAGWDVALLPFARNASTRFISPTKTPEYLAAGKPVVSTSIRDVVRPYGEQGLVRIADDPDEFVQAVEDSLSDDAEERIPEYDRFLANTSWDKTWRAMENLIERTIETNRTGNLVRKAGAV